MHNRDMNTTHRIPCPITGMTLHTHKAAREAREAGRQMVACSNGGTTKLHYHVIIAR